MHNSHLFRIFALRKEKVKKEYILVIIWDYYKKNYHITLFHRSLWQEGFIPIFVKLKGSKAPR